jgi:hypothetical protein
MSVFDLDSAAVVDDCTSVHFWRTARHLLFGSFRLVDRMCRLIASGPLSAHGGSKRKSRRTRSRASSLSDVAEHDHDDAEDSAASGESDALSTVSGVGHSLHSDSDDDDDLQQSTASDDHA